jgi:hypothetical protein
MAVSEAVVLYKNRRRLDRALAARMVGLIDPKLEAQDIVTGKRYERLDAMRKKLKNAKETDPVELSREDAVLLETAATLQQKVQDRRTAIRATKRHMEENADSEWNIKKYDARYRVQEAEDTLKIMPKFNAAYAVVERLRYHLR